jgi:hypothetical protein
MTNSQPIACSLGARDLQQRLAEMAKVGAASLIDRAVDDGRHVLRFRADATTRARLDAIVAAEADCCSFLDLSLVEDAGELVLTIRAPDEAQAVADDLALAFLGASAELF